MLALCSYSFLQYITKCFIRVFYFKVTVLLESIESNNYILALPYYATIIEAGSLLANLLIKN